MEPYKCAACGEPGRSWGKSGTLAGCCPYIRLNDSGKVITLYFGFIHRSCLKAHWKKELANAVDKGWLVPAEKQGIFKPAPQYGGSA